jgi:hypothetical protein
MPDTSINWVLDTDINKLRKLEEKGREIVTFRRDKPAWASVINWVDELQKALRYRRAETEIETKLLLPITDNEKLFCETLSEVLEDIIHDAMYCRIDDNPSLKECDAKLADGECESLDVAFKNLKYDKKCTWMCKEFPEYKLTAAINDITSCFHRLVEKLEERVVPTVEKGKCRWTKDGNESLIKACEEWDKATEIFNKNNLYDGTDYEKLKGIIVDNKAEFTVGSSQGHTTHLDLEKGTVEYYDTDSNVNVEMKKLFEGEGLKCKISETGVVCSGLTKQNVKNVAKKLASATSMDFRIPLPGAWWRKSAEKHPEIKKCEDETCRVEVKIKKEVV